MRLRSLTLENVRRFAGQVARIDGIGDGITVVSEANEFGKTTFFDALHALFFEKYSSSGKSVKTLQPPSGGGVRISAEFDHDGKAYRLEKQFLSKKGAALFEQATNRLIAKDGEAEAWVANALGDSSDGPVGLLWVRQGVLGLEPEGASTGDKKKMTDARRDLMSSVMGEIDAVTGGRRMDRIRQNCEEDLRKIATSTGRPTGEWREANELIAELEEELAGLEAQCVSLQGKLKDRTQVESELERFEAAGLKRKLSDDLKAAEDAFAAAEAQGRLVIEAEQSVAISQLEKDRLEQELTQLDGRAQQLDQAQSKLTKLQADLSDSEQTELAASKALATCAGDVAALKSNLKAAQQVADRVQAQEKAAQAKAELARLTKVIAQIDAQSSAIFTAKAMTRTTEGIDQAVKRAEDLATRILRAETTLAAAAPNLTIRYHGDTYAQIAGKEIAPDSPIPLMQDTDIELPGIASIHIGLPETLGPTSMADLKVWQQDLAALFSDVGVSSMEGMQQKAKERANALSEIETSQKILSALAPEGVDVLRQRLDAAKAAAEMPELEGDQNLPDLEAAQSAVRQAEAELVQAQAKEATATKAKDSSKEALIKLRTEVALIQQDVERLKSDAGDAEARKSARSSLLTRLGVAASKLEDGKSTLENLQKQSADIAIAKANLQRARAAQDAANKRQSELLLRQTELNSHIEAQAGQGIEEQRDEIAERLERARGRAVRFEKDFAALTKLATVLDDMRKKARDTYFGPVQEELKPLLKILHGDAAIEFDSDTIMPKLLSRNGAEEGVDTLSGGTQEQIAILTRLAFARLFARQGRHVPIVLDDALVFSDDDRIIKMFTALTRVAEDQQIVVFTCRQMAFAQLGGHQPVIQITDQH